ncbi:hypothetical protein LXL04_016792 [Taraxacum kok-saghyz]
MTGYLASFEDFFAYQFVLTTGHFGLTVELRDLLTKEEEGCNPVESQDDDRQKFKSFWNVDE